MPIIKVERMDGKVIWTCRFDDRQGISPAPYLDPYGNLILPGSIDSIRPPFRIIVKPS